MYYYIELKDVIVNAFILVSVFVKEVRERVMEELKWNGLQRK